MSDRTACDCEDDLQSFVVTREGKPKVAVHVVFCIRCGSPDPLSIDALSDLTGTKLDAFTGTE